MAVATGLLLGNDYRYMESVETALAMAAFQLGPRAFSQSSGDRTMLEGDDYLLYTQSLRRFCMIFTWFSNYVMYLSGDAYCQGVRPRV